MVVSKKANKQVQEKIYNFTGNRIMQCIYRKLGNMGGNLRLQIL